jgi:hypothetical protein
MLLGQLVAISFATALFFTALSLRPRTRRIRIGNDRFLIFPLVAAMVTIYRNPHVVNTDGFLPNLLTMHGLLLVPLFVHARPTQTSSLNAPTELNEVIQPDGAAEEAPNTKPDSRAAPGAPQVAAPLSVPTTRPQQQDEVVSKLSDLEKTSYVILVAFAVYIHVLNSGPFFAALGKKPLFKTLYHIILSHPAQSSISFDVYWTIFTVLCLFLTSGSPVSIIAKLILTLGLGAAALVNHVGVNWTLVSSIIPIAILTSLGVFQLVLSRGRTRNEKRRKAVLEGLSIIEENVVPGTDKVPPKYAPRRTVVGFWHPYW